MTSLTNRPFIDFFFFSCALHGNRVKTQCLIIMEDEGKSIKGLGYTVQIITHGLYWIFNLYCSYCELYWVIICLKFL